MADDDASDADARRRLNSEVGQLRHEVSRFQQRNAELAQMVEDAEEKDRAQLARVAALKAQRAALERELADKQDDLELPKKLSAEVSSNG